MNPSRRTLLRMSALGAAGLALDLGLDGILRAAPLAVPAEADVFRPSVRLRVARDGAVTIVVGRSEMGQGVRTSLAMIVADELEADWAQVTVEQARPGDGFADLRTSGSGSVMTGWVPLRRLGAAAREMLVLAAARTWKVDPSACRAEAGRVIETASGRALSFGELVPAAASLERPRSPALKAPEAFRLIGKRLERVDARDVVTGRARYGLDVRVEGMLRAIVLRPPTLGGKLVSFDAARARALPGVRDVVAIATGVAIVADDTWAALEARELVRVEWDPGSLRTFDSGVMRARLEQALAGDAIRVRSDGDVDAWIAGAKTVLEALYEYPAQAHAALEPLNAIADVRAGACTIWSGTQAPNQAQEEASRLLERPLESVEVQVPLLGGGFGRRLGTDFTDEAVALSRTIGKPVQIVWTRADDLRHGTYYMPSMHRLRAALDAEGELVAWSHRTAAPSLVRGITGAWKPEFAEEETSGSSDLPYGIPSVRCEYVDVETPIPLGPWRGIQYVQNVFARECFLDEVAHASGRDPLTLRLALLDPARGADASRAGVELGRMRAVLELAAERSGWGRAMPPGKGLGIAVCAYARTCVAHVAEVSVAKDGTWRVVRVTSAVDCGEVVHPGGVEGTVESAVHFGLSALESEITFANGGVVQSSYADFPVLRIDRAPRVEVCVVPSRAHPAGLGEPPVPPIAPAVLNALFAATKKRLRRLPLRASDLA